MVSPFNVEIGQRSSIYARGEQSCENYGEKEAVKNISFQIKPGEIYGFLGHIGAGKTTTIKA